MSTEFKGMIVNDADLYDKVGFFIEGDGVEGWRDGLFVRDRSTNLPGRVGEVALGHRDFESRPREIVVTGIQRATSKSQLRDRLRELRQRLYEGTIEVRFTDDEDKVFNCRAMGVRVIGISPALSQLHHRVRISLEAPDPLIYAREGTVVGFSSDKAEIPLGTAPVFPVLRINGAVTNPTITYKDFRGDTIETFGLTVTLAAGEFREIDMGRSRVTDESGNNAISEWSSGSFFGADPQDAAAEGGPYPTIEISPDCECDTLYRLAWL